MNSKTAMYELRDSVNESQLLNDHTKIIVAAMIDNYLEREKQQIINAWDDGLNKGYTGNPGDAQKHYNETFK